MGKIDNVEWVELGGLKPYENNSKTHSKKQIKQIAESIQEFGFISPVLIDENNVIIAGHGRVEAAKTLTILKIPCIRVEGLTDEQRKAYIIADNRLTELGGWNKELLSSELELLKSNKFKIDIAVTKDRY